MKILHTPLNGVKLLAPDVFIDDRGYFLETHHLSKYSFVGLDIRFVQDNLSHSKQGVLRGLHFQRPDPQGKLIYVVHGEIFDVAVDIRPDSPTFGRWFGVRLSAENHLQLFISPGFAHGFCVLSAEADVIHKCTAFHNRDYEHTLLWNDPDVGIEWPVHDPIVSAKDAAGLRLREVLLPA